VSLEETHGAGVQQPGGIELAETDGQARSLELAREPIPLPTPGKHDQRHPTRGDEARNQPCERDGERTVVQDVCRQHEVERLGVQKFRGRVAQIGDEPPHAPAGALAVEARNPHRLGVVVDGEHVGATVRRGDRGEREPAAELDDATAVQVEAGEVRRERARRRPELRPVGRLARPVGHRVVEQLLGLARTRDAHVQAAPEVDILVNQLDPPSKSHPGQGSVTRSAGRRHTSYVAGKGSAAQAGTLDGLTIAAGDLVERGLAWLTTYGATNVSAELRQRFNGEGPAGVTLCLFATIASNPKDPTPPEATILVELDRRDAPTGARCELTLHGRRKQLRHVARRATKAAKTVESLALAQPPEADKKDPGTLTVVTALDPSEPIEELVSHSMRLLDTLVVELAARRE
jgi:hypothetical protein